MTQDYKVLGKVGGSFSIFDRGRKYSGVQRKYLLENVRDVINSDSTREKIQMREALGYFGHAHRVYSGTMAPKELEIVELPTGEKVTVHNIPSNVTTSLEVDANGDGDA